MSAQAVILIPGIKGSQLLNVNTPNFHPMWRDVRFNVNAVTRDKEYKLTKSEKGSKVLHFSANANGEAELITVYLTAGAKARAKVFDFSFAEIDIKGKGAGGNILTKYPVRKLVMKAEGKSTLKGTDIWFDESIGRLNRDERGAHLGNFNADDKVICFMDDGSYVLSTFELSNHYNPNHIVIIDKFDPERIVTVMHQDGESKIVYIKRFLIESQAVGKNYVFINDAANSKLVHISLAADPMVKVTFRKKGERAKSEKEYALAKFIEKKGWKSIGNKFPVQNVSKVVELMPVKDAEADEDVEVKNAPDVIADLKAEVKKEVESEENKPGYDVGSTVDLNTKPDDEKDQLGLFE